MNLDYIIANFKDADEFKRISKPWVSGKPVEWLKGLKDWGNQESKDMGFSIPSFMIDDANADDWELCK